MTIFHLHTEANVKVSVAKIQSSAELVESFLTPKNECLILWIPHEQLNPLHREIILIHTQHTTFFPIIAVHPYLKDDLNFQELLQDYNIEAQSIIYITSIEDEQLWQEPIISYFKESESIINPLDLEIKDETSYSAKAPKPTSFKDGLKQMFKYSKRKR